ncbi:MAG: hypothetical protein GY765_18065, partial [bacterium]|nr:hypothetical protein [bacterium]
MKNDSAKKFKRISLLMALVLIIGTCLFPQDDADASYNLAVNVNIVPVFAVDSKGNPVYDLKAHELEFKLNGKTQQFQLTRFQFQNVTETERRDKVEVKPDGAIKKVDHRVVFIIVDTMFNSRNGIRRSKKIAKDLISKSFPGNVFIILENIAGGGLRYVAGPERNKKKLFSKINKMSIVPEEYRKNLIIDADEDIRLSKSRPINQFSDKFLNPSAKASEKLRYKTNAMRFVDALKKFKFVLKGITAPKVVFLISEGIPKSAFSSEYKSGLNSNVYANALLKNRNMAVRSMLSPFFYKYLQSIVEIVNDGGSVLYTINPQPINFKNTSDIFNSGEIGLRFMADESGGKYFAGQKLDTVVKQITKSTAAYYELAFSPQFSDAGKQLLEIKCKRKGVKVYTPRHKEKAHSYRMMSDVEKKLFALNIVSGGNWSRMVSKVERTGFKKIKINKRGDANFQLLKLTGVPEAMKKSKVDLFILCID